MEFNPLTIKGNHHKAWEVLRTYLLAQFGNKCIMCGEFSKKIDIHHIDGCALNNALDNLAPLCPSCHHSATDGKVGKHRAWLKKELRDVFL